jgi:hypothetical protein
MTYGPQANDSAMARILRVSTQPYEEPLTHQIMLVGLRGNRAPILINPNA